jgi:hypothetical protein
MTLPLLLLLPLLLMMTMLQFDICCWRVVVVAG